MTLLEIQFGARLRLGEVGDVIGELEAAVAAHPFQESLWELLITAQYRAGRQADALASYQKVRTQLAAELGLDPRPQLQELEHRILVQDAALEVPVRPAARRPHATAVREPSVPGGGAGRPRGRGGCLVRPARPRTAGGDRGAGRYREDGGGDCGRPRADLVGDSRGRWRLAGPARERQHAGPGRRRAGWCGRGPRRRGGAVRVVQGRLRGGDSRQLRTRHRRGRGAGGSTPRRRPGVADPVHQPGPARRRRRGRRRTRPAAARRRCRAVHPPRRGTTPIPTTRGRTPKRCATCAGPWTVCRWRSSWPRHEPRPCPSRRSPGASTTRSSFWPTRPAASRNAAGRCGRPSRGATTCCFPTTSAASGRWPRSRAGHRCRRWSSSSKPSMCRQPRRSTWSAGSRAGPW